MICVIYVLERDSTMITNEPQLFLDGYQATENAEREYRAAKKTIEEKAANCNCYMNINKIECIGEISIDYDDSEYLRWRITKHKIEV